MNLEQQEEFRQERARQAELIKSDLAEYHVCGVCSSVSRRQVAVCWVCHAYQWDESPAAITTAVNEAATSVFPFTLGYAPTYDRCHQSPVVCEL